VDHLASELELMGRVFGVGGASNAWALRPARTASGRTMLAADPHVFAGVPSLWYLARMKWPEQTVVGAAAVGAPAVVPGHNGHCAWGATAAHADNTDLFLERVGPDGESVWDGQAFVPCEVRTEQIKVRGGRTVEEKVLVTPRGPIISPGLSDPPSYGEANALSISGTWLAPRPYNGLFGVHRGRSFEACREAFRQGSTSTVTIVHADADGHVGWFLAVELPRRRRGSGSLPLPGWDPECGWEEGLVPFDDLPREQDPELDFICAANNQPVPERPGDPFLGQDWLDGYRQRRMLEALARRSDWDADACAELQLDTRSAAWDDLRSTVTALRPDDPDARQALDLLSSWDGVVGADSAAAAVFELFVARICQRVVQARAPRSYRWAMGHGFSPLLPHSLVTTRRMSHLVGLLQRRPAGFFDSWEGQMEGALADAVDQLRDAAGSDPAGWAWGKVRPLTLVHVLGEKKPLDRVFNIGPLPGQGDSGTLVQGGVDMADPLANPLSLPTVRAVIDLGNWDECRFSLAGGQSGNPFSPHYADQLQAWSSGKGIAIAWDDDRVRQITRHRLELRPIAG
jgi:penicillin amidase